MALGEPANGRSNEISVVLRGDAVEPLADVVPEGPVTIVVMNESGSPRDVTLVRLEERADGDGLPENTRVSSLQDIEEGGARTVEFDLTRGRYLLILDPGEPTEDEALLDLTVQPVDGEA